MYDLMGVAVVSWLKVNLGLVCIIVLVIEGLFTNFLNHELSELRFWSKQWISAEERYLSCLETLSISVDQDVVHEVAVCVVRCGCLNPVEVVAGNCQVLTLGNWYKQSELIKACLKSRDVFVIFVRLVD